MEEVTTDALTHNVEYKLQLAHKFKFILIVIKDSWGTDPSSSISVGKLLFLGLATGSQVDSQSIQVNPNILTKVYPE